MRNFGDAADILGAAFMRKAKILIQAMTDIIAIKDITRLPMDNQITFQLKGQSGFTCTAQSGQPDGNRPLAQQLGAVGSGYMACMPDDIMAFHDKV